MDLLVIGGSGFLGRAVTRQALLAGHRVVATCHTGVPPAGGDWRAVDIRRRDDVTALAAAVRPEVIVNAAYVQSDWETTADGGTNVALAAAAAGARLVHVSSDAVFSGAAPSYDETCRPDPVTPYGAAKAAQESYTLSAAYELGASGITANMVHPPITDTGWITPAVAEAATAASKAGFAGCGAPRPATNANHNHAQASTSPGTSAGRPAPLRKPIHGIRPSGARKSNVRTGKAVQR